MPKQEKKEKIWLSAFKAEWHVDYFVTKLDGKALCVLYTDTIAVLKKKNIYMSHYQTQHSSNSQDKSQQLEIFKWNITAEFLHKNESVTKISFWVVCLLAN